jgi:glycosyltransferase involved in cell wall biosynthesis
MDYHPNIDGALWFARHVFPELRRRQPATEFLVVGNKPVREVLELAKIEGVVVTGGVEDVRPYIAQAQAVVAPLRLARGIQNKVLEGLALGRPVYGSTAICQTFGREIPKGLRECKTAADFVARILPDLESVAAPDHDIREQMMQRFQWEKNLEILDSRLESLTRKPDQPRLTSLSGVLHV